jgi:hypothetical protein
MSGNYAKKLFCVVIDDKSIRVLEQVAKFPKSTVLICKKISKKTFERNLKAGAGHNGVDGVKNYH